MDLTFRTVLFVRCVSSAYLIKTLTQGTPFSRCFLRPPFFVQRICLYKPFRHGVRDRDGESLDVPYNCMIFKTLLEVGFLDESERIGAQGDLCLDK